VSRDISWRQFLQRGTLFSGATLLPYLFSTEHSRQLKGETRKHLSPKFLAPAGTTTYWEMRSARPAGWIFSEICPIQEPWRGSMTAPYDLAPLPDSAVSRESGADSPARTSRITAWHFGPAHFIEPS
jgi:hypothetical protein